jgi:acid stress-induced BolA-like protein IbaG/YrbA
LYHNAFYISIGILEVIMDTSEVKQIIEAGINDSEAIVTADGNKYTAIVVADEFEGKSMLAEQKMVYALMNDYIQSGAIHALTIKAYTKAEWAEKQ